MRLFIAFTVVALSVLSCKNDEATDTTSDEVASEIDSSYCECHELVFDEAYNHFYRFNRRKGFTGKCEEFYPNGQLKLDKNFVDGKVHGKMISYHENGQIWEDQEFDMNFQNGEKITYTQSGQVMFHALYKRGKQIEVIDSKPWLTVED